MLLSLQAHLLHLTKLFSLLFGLFLLLLHKLNFLLPVYLYLVFIFLHVFLGLIKAHIVVITKVIKYSL
jgi:hypothetical protein